MKLKQLTIAALMSALLIVVILIDTRFSYFLSYNIGFILPLPLIIIGVKEGINVSNLITISTTILLIIFGQFLAIINVLPACLIGLLAIKRINEKAKLFWAMLISNSIFVIIQYYFFAYILKIEVDIFTEISEMANYFNMTIQHTTIWLLAIIVVALQSLLQTIIILKGYQIIKIRFLKEV